MIVFEILGLIAVGLAGGILVGWLVWRHARPTLARRVAELEGVKAYLEENNERLFERSHQAETQRDDLDRQVQELTADLAQQSALRLRLGDALHVAEQKYEDAINHSQDLEAKARQLDQNIAQLRAFIERGTERGLSVQKQLQVLQKQADDVLNQHGRVWEAPLRPPVCPFVPRPTRKFPIISVLNFKGGVGKTTLTLNLGRALVGTGEKVLLFDLDYQRSLTALCLTASRAQALTREKRSLQHFLAGPTHDAATLSRCVEGETRVQGCSLVANTDPESGKDGLEEVEAHLLTEWLVRPEARDVRLFLREALHAPEFAGRFDHILLDCPPRLSVACINALAASDYVLIPVILDGLSTAAVPRLLQFLRRLKRSGILPNLEVLGIVANRTSYYRDVLVSQEREVRTELVDLSKAGWGEPVHFFEVTIKDNVAFRNAADNIVNESKSTLASDANEEIQSIFQQLAAQVKERLKHASGQLAAIPS